MRRNAARQTLLTSPSLAATSVPARQLVFLAFIAIQAIVVLVMIALVYAVVQAVRPLDASANPSCLTGSHLEQNTGDLSTEDFLGSDPQLESVATYLGLFILAVCAHTHSLSRTSEQPSHLARDVAHSIFEIGVCLDGMHKKNIMTLFVLCLFQVCMLVYSAVLPGQLEEAITGSNADTPHVQRLTRAYAIVIPSVVGACSLCMTAMLWPLYHEFGWNVLCAFPFAPSSFLFSFPARARTPTHLILRFQQTHRRRHCDPAGLPAVPGLRLRVEVRRVLLGRLQPPVPHPGHRNAHCRVWCVSLDWTVFSGRRSRG